MKSKKLRAIAATASLIVAGGNAFSQATDVPIDPTLEKQISQVAKKVMDANGLEFSGYMRSGFYSADTGKQTGQYQLGGSLDHYRLGNEGDNYFEVMIGKNFEFGDGGKWGVHWMPNYYNGTTGTPQIYANISGLSFAPGVEFWAGQRWHRIQDIHVIDNFLMVDGDNYGAGADGIDVGYGKLNLAAFSDGSSGNNNKPTANNAHRINLQWRDLPVNSGGKLTLTGGVVNGTFGQGSNGSALGLLHNQSDFLVSGLTNSFFLQGSTGHTDIDGKFYHEDDPVAGAQNGANQSRIVDSINWQSGAFGGQALVGYHTITPDGGVATKDYSIGGRVSYGVAKNVKLLGELGVTQRKTDGQNDQQLNKATVAVALSPANGFWNRPELRFYVTRANWNDAAAAANSGSYGANGATDGTTVGLQLEAWW